MTVNYIKQKMNDGHAVLGPFLKMNDPALIEQAALAGFDFCIIYMEHGPTVLSLPRILSVLQSFME